MGIADDAEGRRRAAAFRQALQQSGWKEGSNVRIDERWGVADTDVIRATAIELLQLNPSVVVVQGARAVPILLQATKTVPIVFVSISDPVKYGLVSAFNRPGGNITGVVFFAALAAKRLELLRQLVPKATTIAVLVSPDPDTEAERREVEAAAQATGQQVIVLYVSSDRDIDAAFATIIKRGAGALLSLGGAFFNSRRERLVALAARHALPVTYPWREATAAGGLMSYGTSITDAYRQVGIYAGRILKGEKPRDLPVVQPTKFELVINLATAKALGLDVPPTLLAIADEVIE